MAEPGCLHDAHFSSLEVNKCMSIKEQINGGIHIHQHKSNLNYNTSLLIGINRGGNNTTNPFLQSETPLFKIGSELIYSDKKFRYVKAGSSISSGLLVQGCAASLDTRLASSVSSRTVQLTVTTDVDDLFKNKYIQISGRLLRIKGNKDGLLTLYDPSDLSITVNTTVYIVPDIYDGVIISQSTPTNCILGVSQINVTINYYFWLQTYGPASIKYNEDSGSTSLQTNISMGNSSEVPGNITVNTNSIGKCVLYNSSTTTNNYIIVLLNL